MTGKAIGYLRVSSASQAQDGKDGFPRQRAAVRAYCTSKRLELVEEHADAVSGTTPLEGREALSEALRRCDVVGASVLVVERVDRLGRDLVVSEMIVKAFRDAGVSIVSADTGESLTDAENDPSRKLIRQVLAALAEYERSALVAKLRAARDRKKRNGGHSVGCYRFGEHPERPGERETLARIRELRRVRGGRRRSSMADVAAVLNDEGRESRSGRTWSAAMVRDVVAR